MRGGEPRRRCWCRAQRSTPPMRQMGFETSWRRSASAATPPRLARFSALRVRPAGAASDDQRGRLPRKSPRLGRSGNWWLAPHRPGQGRSHHGTQNRRTQCEGLHDGHREPPVRGIETDAVMASPAAAASVLPDTWSVRGKPTRGDPSKKPKRARGEITKDSWRGDVSESRTCAKRPRNGLVPVAGGTIRPRLDSNLRTISVCANAKCVVSSLTTSYRGRSVSYNDGAVKMTSRCRSAVRGMSSV